MLHMRRRSSIRTSRAEVEHAPGGLPLAQQRHCALLFCPNTDTGPEAGNKLARTQLPAEYKNMIPLPKVLQGKQERGIKKKGKRKNKFLFCLPGQVALSGNAELGPIENIEPDQPIGLGGGAARIV